MGDGTASTRDLVFVSYSHADEPPWLTRLRIVLKPYVRAGKLQEWSDPYIQVGDTWRRQIGNALARAKIGVCLVSPNFLASDFIMDEEVPPLLKAAKAGETTIVAVPISAVDIDITPFEHLQWAHDPKTPLGLLSDDEQRNAALVRIVKTIAQLAGTALTERRAVETITVEAAAPVPEPTPLTGNAAALPGQLHGVPPQRPNFVARNEDLARVKAHLLAATTGAVGITGSRPGDGGRAIGLHGMGGIGKTELAVALVHDDEARRAFPDGIFWLTLGQTPDVLPLQGTLWRMGTGSEPAFVDLGAGQRALLDLFREKAALIVLDDIWRAADMVPLTVAGPQGRMLTTTRDASLLTALGAAEVSLDVLSEGRALQLLANWSGQDRDALPETAEAVAKECGYLPLALALAGAQVKDGLGWADVLAALRKGNLEFLDHPYGSVFKSLRASVAALLAAEAARYGELVVALEDVPLPGPVVGRLWRKTAELAEYETHKLLRTFANKALLSLTGDGEGATVGFHDLQYDFLRLNAEDPRAPHQALLDAYGDDLGARSQDPAAGWARLPKDETYLWSRLADHFVAAGREGELRALLLDDRWIAAKLAATDVNALLADYDRLMGDENLKLVHGALQLSANILTRDTSQLAGQLKGRLQGLERPKIAALVARIERQARRPWLSPQTRSLRSPGGLPIAGHVGSVLALAVTPDGTRAVSGSSDCTVRMWDLPTCAELRCLEGHASPVSAVALTQDGTRVLSAHRDYTLRLWDLATGTQLRCLRGHRRRIVALAMMPDGTQAVSTSADHTLRLWNLSTGDELRCLGDYKDWVMALAVMPDGTGVVSASSDGTLRLWDLKTDPELRRLKGHQNWLLVLAVTPDGTRVVSGSLDRTLRLWDLTTCTELRRFEGHEDQVNAVSVTPDGTKLLSGSSDRTLRLWDMVSGEEVCCYSADGAILSAACANNATFVAGSVDGAVHMLKLTT